MTAGRIICAPLANGATATSGPSGQNSSMLKLFSQADALLVRKPHCPPLEDGATVEIVPLD